MEKFSRTKSVFFFDFTYRVKISVRSDQLIIKKIPKFRSDPLNVFYLTEQNRWEIDFYPIEFSKEHLASIAGWQEGGCALQ